MNSRERANRFFLARTGLNQNGKEGKMLVYKKTGVPSSAIVAYEDPESTRALNVNYVQKLAEHYGVNAAWLLGQSESWSLEKDIRQVCEMTGLSADAVYALQDLMEDEKQKRFVNSLLASEEFSRMIHMMAGMKRIDDSDRGKSVDYTEALNSAAGEDLEFCEKDLADMRVWKASREMEKVIRMLADK